MTPSEPPSDDNAGTLPEREPGLFSTRKRAIESTLSLCGIAAIYSFGYSYLSPESWRGMWLTIGGIFLVSLVAALYRRVVYGRA